MSSLSSSDSFDFIWLTPKEVNSLRHEIVEVYLAAFSQPPYNKDEAGAISFNGTLLRHAARQGFRFLAAREAEGSIAGFAYGYTGQPGQWWHDLVAAALSPVDYKRWLEDAFELVELAVRPDYQGRGLGSQLFDRLLEGLPHRTTLLSTMPQETVASKMYRNRGWQVLLSDFYFPNVKEPYVIMGKETADKNLQGKNEGTPVR